MTHMRRDLIFVHIYCPPKLSLTLTIQKHCGQTLCTPSELGTCLRAVNKNINDYPHTPPDYRHTDKMVQPWERWLTDRRTLLNVLSPCFAKATQSIIVFGKCIVTWQWGRVCSKLTSECYRAESSRSLPWYEGVKLGQCKLALLVFTQILSVHQHTRNQLPWHTTKQVHYSNIIRWHKIHIRTALANVNISLQMWHTSYILYKFSRSLNWYNTSICMNFKFLPDSSLSVIDKQLRSNTFPCQFVTSFFTYTNVLVYETRQLIT